MLDDEYMCIRTVSRLEENTCKLIEAISVYRFKNNWLRILNLCGKMETIGSSSWLTKNILLKHLTKTVQSQYSADSFNQIPLSKLNELENLREL